MQKPCTKAIIPVGGFGTRRLPVTKAIEKCMLPVGDRPIIDYVVEDCVRAGITDIIFVVSEDFAQLKRYYGHNQRLERYLADKGKTKELAEVQSLAHKARFRYVVQGADQPYGTNTPVYLCRDLVDEDEQVLVVFGDQFFYRRDGSSEIAAFLRLARSAGTPGAMLAMEVARDDITKYGIVASRPSGAVELYERIVEKPSLADAPSNLANASCFVLNHNIFTCVANVYHRPQDGEHYLIDAINDYVRTGNQVAVLRAQGEYLDCGTTDGWLHANNRVVSTQQH